MCRFNEKKERRVMSEINSQMKDMVTDTRISLLESRENENQNMYKVINQVSAILLKMCNVVAPLHKILKLNYSIREPIII